MGKLYDVTITAIGGAAPADGFIDPKSSYFYMDSASDAPNTLALAKAKMRANRRYKNLITTVQGMCNAYVVSVATPGASADTAPTSITVRFDVEHGAAVLRTADESNSGQFLTGTDALKRVVARALMISETRNVEYYDPTVVAGRDIDGADNAGRARGPVIMQETVGALTEVLATAEAAVTVAAV